MLARFSLLYSAVYDMLCCPSDSVYSVKRACVRIGISVWTGVAWDLGGWTLLLGMVVWRLRVRLRFMREIFVDLAKDEQSNAKAKMFHGCHMLSVFALKCLS